MNPTPRPTSTPTEHSTPRTQPRTEQHTRLYERYGPTAVVTGATSGIGRGCAAYLAAAGFDLVIVARSHHALHDLATELESSFGIDVQIVAADLSTDTGIDMVASATAGLDVGLFVPAAGYGTAGPMIDNDPASEADMITVNCRAVMSLTHVLARRMSQRGRGGIVLFSSVVATQGVPLSANYAATKAYIHTLGEGLRHELAPHGVDVVISAPGPVDSGFSRRAHIQMGSTMSAELVARSSLHALGRRAIVRPGGLSKLLGWSLAMCPRRTRTIILGRIFRGFTTHRPTTTNPERP